MNKVHFSMVLNFKMVPTYIIVIFKQETLIFSNTVSALLYPLAIFHSTLWQWSVSGKDLADKKAGKIVKYIYICICIYVYKYMYI